MRHTKRYTPWYACVGLLTLLGFATACASGGSTSEPGSAATPGVTMLEVHNTDESGQPLLIYLAAEAGEATVLGRVAPDDVLSMAHPGGQGRYQFRAERPDGSIVTSPMFTVVSGTYSWDIALRRVERKR